MCGCSIRSVLVLLFLLGVLESRALAAPDAGDPSEPDGGLVEGDAQVDSGLDAGLDSGEPLESDGGFNGKDAYTDDLPDAGVESKESPEQDAGPAPEVSAAPEPQSAEDAETVSDTTDKVEYTDEIPDRDSVEEYGATARIQPTDEVTGFAETVPIEEQRKTVSDLSEVLSKSVGIQVRRMGGLGSYGAASIRGSTPNQVPVFLDGIQLNMGGFSVVNLGDFSLDTLESVEVYRGNAPLALGTGGIGGAIVLKTKRLREPVKEYSISHGSWNTWRQLALYSDEIATVDSLVIVSREYSDGGFIYYDRHGTNVRTSDDAFVPRTNNGHSAASALLKLNRRFGDWDVVLMDNFFFKDRGLAGIDHMYGKSDAKLGTVRNGFNLRFERPIVDIALVDLDLIYLVLGESYRDLQNDVGVGYDDSDYLTNGISAVALLRTVLSQEHLTTYRLACRYENYDEHRVKLDADQQQSPSHRFRTELGAEHDWVIVPRLHIVPTVRGEVHYAYFGGGPIPALFEDFPATTTTDLFFSPSLGVRYEIVDGVTLRANAGRYVRTPELTELFGDRGTMVGNPELKFEVGYNLDAGLTYLFTSRTALDSLRADVAWFGGWVEDLISFEQNSQGTNHPINIDAASIQGFELGLRIAMFGVATLSGNYTFFHGVNRSNIDRYRGKQLPGRPPHEIYGRVDLGKTFTHWGLGGWFDVDYAGKAYVHPYNEEVKVSKHLFLGTGSRLELPRAGLTFTFEVKNLLDALVFKNDEGDWLPMSDYDRYPLPGRTFLGTIHWRWL